MKLDIEAYRVKHAPNDAHSIQNDIVAALSNPDNIVLWKNGIERPNHTTPSDAYSHFHGFRNLTIDRASVVAQTTDRFLANKIEDVLDPHQVQLFVNSLNISERQSALQSKASQFVQQRFEKTPTRSLG